MEKLSFTMDDVREAQKTSKEAAKAAEKPEKKGEE